MKCCKILLWITLLDTDCKVARKYYIFDVKSIQTHDLRDSSLFFYICLLSSRYCFVNLETILEWKHTFQKMSTDHVNRMLRLNVNWTCSALRCTGWHSSWCYIFVLTPTQNLNSLIGHKFSEPTIGSAHGMWLNRRLPIPLQRNFS